VCFNSCVNCRKALAENAITILQQSLQQAVAEADKKLNRKCCRNAAAFLAAKIVPAGIFLKKQKGEYSSYLWGPSFSTSAGGHVSWDCCPKGLVHFGMRSRIKGESGK
jgi:hypothetical protein